ncbi:CocE/NonD family hydrolase [Mesorhizobium caraganae]|uniref:CocE/NonD family hydrolase n=1 Tax=Mesorhizobium caraganae TaxID=483206 RepID=UPI00248397BD|nr:CocE/NonD family hydrolase [Mesorhizobium caraganae]
MNTRAPAVSSCDDHAALLTSVGAKAFAATTDGPQTSQAAVRTGPRKVREIENIWIPMSDGTKIAARMWLPDDAESHPVPVLMEYIPYRKRVQLASS